MYIGQTGESQIEFVIEGYQHAEATNNYFEANWLMVALSVVNHQKYSGRQKRRSFFPMNWIVLLIGCRLLSGNLAPNRYFDFEEPSLYVCVTERTSHTITLEFHLHLDFRCPNEDNQETRVAVTVSFAELDSWVRQLKVYADRYPVRYVFNVL